MAPEEKLELILQMDRKVTSLLELKARLPEGHTSHADIDNVVGRLLQHIGRVRAVPEEA
jgi:hypothetical protein